jgi:DNA-binding response OmpR family regulator
VKILILGKEAESSDLELIIKLKKHESFVAKDVISAIFLLEKEEPHLIFFDLVFLKTSSGLSLFERIRKSGREGKIFLTCSPNAIDEELASQIGADGVVFKPFRMTEISKLIDKICEELK